MSVRTSSSRPARRPLALAVALALAALTQGALAAPPLPSGFDHNGLYGNVGAPTLDNTGRTMTINQTSKGAVIQWDSFNIDQGYHVAFVQPGSDSVTLNRVTGNGGASQINGLLSAPGRVFVVNPSGVLFGSTAQVNVGGLVASTLDISDANFISGVSSGSFAFDGNVGGSGVSNAGSITAGTGGTIALLSADTVSNSGTLNAPGGTVALGWGRSLVLDIGGDGLTNLVIGPNGGGQGSASIVNSGTLQADGGQVVLRADLGDSMGVVNQGGIVRAHSLSSRGGVIVLDAGSNELDIGGGNDASAGDAGIAGGTITASADHLLVDGGAAFNAGGGTGGANGSLAINSLSSVLIAGQDTLASEHNDNSLSGYTLLLDGALGGALSHNTNVTVNALGYPASQDVTGVRDGSIWMMAGADTNTQNGNGEEIYFPDATIAKTTGGDAQLTFNANRDIRLQAPNGSTTSGTRISSSSGALGVDFNADASGQPQDYGNGQIESGGQIALAGASIVTNGGAVRFYGQSDPAGGRATGSTTFSSSYEPGNPYGNSVVNNAGIELVQSTIDTCAGGDACSGAGLISMRGQGVDQIEQSGTTYVYGGIGIGLTGSTLMSGSGAISLDGRGGTGADGVYIDAYVNRNNIAFFSNRGTPSLIQSRQGSISIAGVAGDQAAPPVGTPVPVVEDIGNGVSVLGGSQVLAGGDLTVSGRGGDLTPSLDAAAANGNYQLPSDGIDLVGATLQAGSGRTLSLTGTAGSAGTGQDYNGNPVPGVAALRSTDIPAYVDTNNPDNDLPAIPGTFAASAGTIRMNGTGDVYLDNSSLSTASASGAGGGIALSAGNILLGAAATLDSSGASQGGSIDVQASGVLAMDAGASVHADAAGAGVQGGNVTLDGAQGLYAYGTLSARGGSAGTGGQVETSGSGVDVRGLAVDATSSGGTAGSWLIDPYNVTITHGNAAGSLPTNPFVPLATTTIQDADISNALNGGSNVVLTTGTGGNQSGNVLLDNVDIERTAGTLPLTFRIDASGSITYRGAAGTIASTGAAGPLNLMFDANANGTNNGDAYLGEIDLLGANLLSNGGDVMLYGQGDPVNGYASSSQLGVHLYQSNIDTRVGQSDAGAGGSVVIRGSANDSVLAETGIDLSGTSIATATGDITLRGNVETGDDAGVGLSGRLVGNTVVPTQLSTTSGNITLDGTSLLDNDQAPKWGVRLGGITAAGLNGVVINDLGGVSISSQSGDIAILGRSEGSAGSTLVNTGVQLGTGVTISNVSGRTLIAGETTSGAAGVQLDNGASVNGGNGTVVVQAHNDGTGDALVLNGTLASGGSIDLRPGGVDANGNATEDPADAIALGTGTGFALSAAELGNIDAGTLILGSDVQVGAITVNAPVDYGHNLTLDGGIGGDIAVNGALDLGANTLALVGAGNIAQSAPITAASLLAQSGSGAVNLSDPYNDVSSATLAGSAAGAFSFVNAGTVGIGNVTATGFGAAANAPTTLAANGIAAGGNVLVRATKGDLLLGAPVSGNDVDLVSSGIFDNAGGNAITAAGSWRVWGDTWQGENRGGLAGGGNLPNLYGCSFGAACISGISVPAAGNHFIYAEQPTATIVVGDATREYGLPNGAFAYAVNGMILGDQAANAIAGGPSTTATQASHVGDYAIGGNFTSPAGYVVDIVAGTLAVTPATLTYDADPSSRLYGDPNGTLGGSVSGFRNGDTLATATTGTLAFSSPATQGSNVGKYAIDGGGLQAGDYVFVQAPGNATALTVAPATLTYVADPYRRMVGVPNGALGGEVVGLRNGDTLTTATTGILAFQTGAGTDSPAGVYAIYGSGLQANNYVFAQAQGNATALTITPPPAVYTLDVVRDTPVSYVYDRNFGIVGLCPATDLTADSRDKDGDNLAREWSRVRSRPNLANCVSTKQKNSCGDF